jgi:putative SOS response-associated peptidase YedK
LSYQAVKTSISQVVETFTIITTEPNLMAARVHNRMPVILGPEHYSWWLEPKYEPEFLKTLLRPFPAKLMQCSRVSLRVNDARNAHVADHYPRLIPHLFSRQFQTTRLRIVAEWQLFDFLELPQ